MASDRPPIIAFDSNDWFGSMSNRQQLLGRLARRGWPVVYSSGALSLWERNTDRWHQAGLCSTILSDEGVRVYRAGRFPPRWPTWQAWDRIVLSKHAAELRKLAGAPRGGNFISFLFNPEFAPYARALAARWLVFHHRDAYAEFASWNDELEADFLQLNADADLLTICARPLLENIAPLDRERARLLGNAADAELFSTGVAQPCPDDLRAIPRPRIGYVGLISLKVDFELIRDIADRQPEWHWVLIGRVVTDSQGVFVGKLEQECRWREVLARPNVHYLGPRDYHSLPAYVGHMDANALVYNVGNTLGKWARFALPLKLYEALATGKPVVSCQLSELESMQGFLEIVGSSADEWVDALGRAISGRAPGSPEQRRAAAAANSWDGRVDDLEQWLEEMIRDN